MKPLNASGLRPGGPPVVLALAGALSLLGCAAPPGQAPSKLELSGDGRRPMATAYEDDVQRDDERDESDERDDGDAKDGDDSPPNACGGDPRGEIASRLGAPGRLLIGLGNDVTAVEGWDPNRAHAYELGRKLDIHYLYLSGLDWPTWDSPEGAYVTLHAQAAKARGVIPMFTLYQAAARGENKLESFADVGFMTQYWRGVRVMFSRLGELGSPSIVHLEPDLWGYFQQKGDSPSSVRVKVGSLVPECAGMSEDAAGFGECLVKLGRQLSPKAILGLSASSFGAHTNGKSDPQRIAKYLSKVGAAASDIVVVETLDRDAGCFEKGVDALCQRSGSFYWRDSDFREHLAWAKTIHQVTGKPLLWWQMPLGVPSSTAGGSAGRYRDNRVEWLFAHPREFADAGGVGAVFGNGAPNQTTTKTDGGQFARAVAGYYEQPTWF